MFLGDYNTYSSEFNDGFELINRSDHLPSVIYVDRFCNADSCETDGCWGDCDKAVEVEIGRCNIGYNWGTPWLYISDFEIMKKHRREGYGTAFFNDLKQFARNRGFSYIWLNPKREDGGVSRSFWEHMGGVHVTDMNDISNMPDQLTRPHSNSLVFDLDINKDDSNTNEVD